MPEQQGLDILLVDDDASIREVLSDFLRQAHHRVFEAPDGLIARDLADHRSFDIAFIDVRMPGVDGLTLMGWLHAKNPAMAMVIITGYGTMDIAIEAFRQGAIDFLRKPVVFSEITGIIERIRTTSENSPAQPDPVTTSGPSSPRHKPAVSRLIGTSTMIKQVRQRISQAVEACCEAILLQGETGTGKEVVAREIHRLAGPASASFVSVSCPAIPESLLESEFFGHIRGSFTGATVDRIGCFELSRNGTLFLDEVGDLPWLGQAKLLRALETRTIRRVGDAKERKISLRVIAATNSPLENMVQSGRFRPDLFFRLNAFTIILEPLRNRPEDIPLLADYFLAHNPLARKKALRGFTRDALETLMIYHFPGNVRELKSIINGACIFCDSGLIKSTDLWAHSGGAVLNEAEDGLTMEDCDGRERSLMLRILELAHWNRTKAAEMLQMPYSTFRYKLKKYMISRDSAID
jgi:DNA-binding NtrC family response regulator